jgi:hypothetical protein
VSLRGKLVRFSLGLKDEVIRRAVRGIEDYLLGLEKSLTELETTVGGLASPPASVPPTRTINTTAPLTGGGDLTADRTLGINSFTSVTQGAVNASGGGTTNFLRADGSWAVPPGSGGVSDGDKGDVVVSGGGATWLLDTNAVSDTKLRDSAALSVIGRATNTAGDPADIAAAADGDVLRRAGTALGFGTIPQASVTSLVADLAATAPTSRTIGTTAPLTGGGDLSANRTLGVNTFGAAQAGVVPLSGGGTVNFLRADGIWAVPAGGSADGLGPDGDKGDITVGGSGTTLTIDANAVTLSKMAQVTAPVVLGRTTGGLGNVEAMTPAQTTALLDTFAASAKGLVPSPAGGTDPDTYLSHTGWNARGYRPKWYGQIYGAYGSCDPGFVMQQIQRGGVVAPTPTNISTTVARCSLFIPPADLTVANIRWYAVGTTASGIFRVAIYLYSNTAPTRVTTDIAIATTANAWGAVVVPPTVKLDKGVPYFIAVSATAAGATAGPQAFGTTVAATTGQTQTAPQNLPGSLRASLNYLPGYLFACTVAAGVLPATLGAPVTHGAWTGGMPAFFLDAA